MKKYVLVSLTIIAFFVGGVAFAQDKPSQKDKSKADKAKKEWIEEKIVSDEIIIRKKGDKNSKVTIEINGSEVKVNGKPIDEFEDENVAILRRSQPRWYSADSRFRTMAPLANITGTYPGSYSFSSGNKAFLGVTTDDAEDGAEIESVVDGSGAEKAGLKEGDIIIKIEDKKIENAGDLTKAIAKQKPEDKVTITYKRDGKENKVTATLGKNKNTSFGQGYSFSGPDGFSSPRVFGSDDAFRLDIDKYRDGNNLYYFHNGKPRLGIKAQDTEEGVGVKVLEVSKESLAEKAGIKEGDIILSFDGNKVNNADELVEAAQESREKASVKVEITRNGAAQTIEIKTPKKLKTANL